MLLSFKWPASLTCLKCCPQMLMCFLGSQSSQLPSFSVNWKSEEFQASVSSKTDKRSRIGIAGPRLSGGGASLPRPQRAWVSGTRYEARIGNAHVQPRIPRVDKRSLTFNMYIEFCAGVAPFKFNSSSLYRKLSCNGESTVQECQQLRLLNQI